jgi:hypothetical protein
MASEMVHLDQDHHEELPSLALVVDEHPAPVPARQSTRVRTEGVAYLPGERRSLEERELRLKTD